jgi:hypothetical protein
MEQRSNPRAQLALALILKRHKGGPVAGRTIDVSPGGARVTTDRPLRVDELLARAGEGAGQLAQLIDAFLERAPRREPTENSRAAVAALATRLEREPPLLSARLRTRRRVSDVVQAIVTACQLPAAATELVQSYYQRLEGGMLDPRAVSAAIWAALEPLLGPDARKLAMTGYGAPPAPVRSVVLFQRGATDGFAAARVAAEPEESVSADVRRRVALLFTGSTAE